MSDEPRHEAVVGAALLAGLIADGLMEAPVKFDRDKLRGRLMAAGGVRMDPEAAVFWGMGMMERAGGLDPEQADQRAGVERLMLEQYDKLIADVGRGAPIERQETGDGGT